jgi:hypothetical protein
MPRTGPKFGPRFSEIGKEPDRTELRLHYLVMLWFGLVPLDSTCDGLGNATSRYGWFGFHKLESLVSFDFVYGSSERFVPKKELSLQYTTRIRRYSQTRARTCCRISRNEQAKKRE